MFAPLIDPPMYVVTCKADNELSGCLIAFATQCSIRPQRFVACLSIENHTYRVAEQASSLAVHLLTEDDRAIAVLFGGKTGDEVDKFQDVAWHLGKTGAPILTECKSYIEGEILMKVAFGDHVGFLLDVVEEVDPSSEDGEQLTLKDVEDLTPGHPIGETK